MNFHGHDHNNIEKYAENCKHINLAANVCDYMPVSLGKLIKEGILSDIVDLHRMTINKAVEKKVKESVCRTFYEKYPASISEYIKYYLEEYEPEVLKENCEETIDGGIMEENDGNN